MGADFKGKTKKTFEKCWDMAAVEANTPDLFIRPADFTSNHFEAEPIGNSSISVGDSVCIRLENGEIIGRRGISPIFRIANSTPELIGAITKGCNIASATVVASDPFSGIFEVCVNK